MATKRVPEKKLVVSPGTAKAPSARKASPPKRTTRSTASVEVVNSAATAISTHAISTQAIAALAYSYWVDRGCEGGSPEEDWLRAERELSESLAVVTYRKARA